MCVCVCVSTSAACTPLERNPSPREVCIVISGADRGLATEQKSPLFPLRGEWRGDNHVAMRG